MEKESISDNISLSQVKTFGLIDNMIRHGERTLTFYKQDALTKSVEELNHILWHAEVIRERIKKEY